MKTTITFILLVVVGAVGGYYIRDYLNESNAKNVEQNTTGQSDSSVENSNPKITGKTADLSNKGLSEFPKNILSDKSLVSINLSGNNLTGAIPGEIRHLSNLEELNLSDNNMTGIPAEVGQLKKLRILNYANNGITGLPMELGNLTQLEVLDLRGNDVSQQDLAKIRAKLTNTEIRL